MPVRADAKSARMAKAEKALPKPKDLERHKERKNKIVPATAHNQRALRSGGISIRNQAIIDAVIDPSTLDDWDEEELERGYRRDKNGHFTGRPPKYLPYVVAMEVMRRQKIQAIINLSKLGPRAMKTLQKVMLDDNDRKAQVAASKIIVDRLAPLTQSSDVNVNVNVQPKFLGVLEKGIVPGAELDDEIIDAEIID